MVGKGTLLAVYGCRRHSPATPWVFHSMWPRFLSTCGVHSWETAESRASLHGLLISRLFHLIAVIAWCVTIDAQHTRGWGQAGFPLGPGSWLLRQGPRQHPRWSLCTGRPLSLTQASSPGWKMIQQNRTPASSLHTHNGQLKQETPKGSVVVISGERVGVHSSDDESRFLCPSASPKRSPRRSWLQSSLAGRSFVICSRCWVGGGSWQKGSGSPLRWGLAKHHFPGANRRRAGWVHENTFSTWVLWGLGHLKKKSQMSVIP